MWVRCSIIYSLEVALNNEFGVCCSFVQIMFNIEKAHFIVDEMVMNGHICDSNKKNVLETVRLMDRKLTS